MGDVLSFMELLVRFYFIKSNFKYELFAVWSLSCNLCLDFAYCELYYSQHVIDEGSERESPKLRNYSLLLFDSSLVLWDCVLLHV
jgi:hypothetical protein